MFWQTFSVLMAFLSAVLVTAAIVLVLIPPLNYFWKRWAYSWKEK